VGQQRVARHLLAAGEQRHLVLATARSMTFDPLVDVTQLFSLLENAISNEPSAPPFRLPSLKGPGSLQPQQIDGTALRASVGGTWPNRRANGVRSQCRRSLTLVEKSLNPVEEIMSVPGAHAVPRWFSQPAALDSAVGAGTIAGNTVTGPVPSDLSSVPTDSAPVHSDLVAVHTDSAPVHTDFAPVSSITSSAL
jgi:hypothetical protein